MSGNLTPAPQQVEPDWFCFACAINLDLDPVDPPAPDVHCVSCGTLANPCAVLRTEVQQLMDVIQAVRAAVQNQAAARAAAAPSGSPNAMKPAEAAAYLRLPSTRALYQAVRRGQVPVHRLGRRMRFERAELDVVLARR